MAFDPLSAAFEFGGKLIDKFFTTPAEKAAATQQLLEMKQKGELAQLAADTQLMQGQIDINRIEAGSANWFVAGWRPFIGWVLGIALLYALVVSPVLAGFAALAGHVVVMPTLNTELLTTMLLALLGLSTQRSVEKINDAQGNH